MKPRHNSTAAPPASPVRCDVAAYGCVHAAPDEFPVLRQRAGQGLGQSLPNNFLKHADEQSVAALGAVLQAIDKFQLTTSNLSRWGIVAAPFFLGRATLVQALQRFAVEGAWGVSPHFIPHRSQHAISGTISQALKIHGPNFGVGGGPGGAAEALLAGAVLLEGGPLPGVWVVLTGWDPEYMPDEEGRPTCPTICRAVALALVKACPEWQGTRLTVHPAKRPGRHTSRAGETSPAVPTLAALQEAVRDSSAIPTPLTWRLEGDGCLELTRGREDITAQPAAFAQRSARHAHGCEQARAGTEKKW